LRHHRSFKRARLLLTVGRLRRRLLRLTPAEVAWLPPPPPRPPTPDPAAEAAAAADAAAKGKGKGKGKTDLAIEPAEAALRPALFVQAPSTCSACPSVTPSAPPRPRCWAP
jgi:hypothetical protein